MLNILCINSSLQVWKEQERKEVLFNKDISGRFRAGTQTPTGVQLPEAFWNENKVVENQSGFCLLGFQTVQDYLFSLNKIVQY